jgi:hypothetical protein
VDTPSWAAFSNPADGIGTWTETSQVSTVYNFVDDMGPDTTGGAPAQDGRYYKIKVERP